MFCLYEVSGHGDSRCCDFEIRFHAYQMFLTRLKVPFGLWEICYEIVILKLRKCKFRILYTQPYVSTSSMPYFVCKQSCWNIEEKSAFFSLWKHSNAFKRTFCLALSGDGEMDDGSICRVVFVYFDNVWLVLLLALLQPSLLWGLWDQQVFYRNAHCQI